VKPGDAVIVARAEHNAALRPLFAAQQRGACLAWAPMATHGFIDLAELECLLQTGMDQGSPFKAVVCRHGSNTSGALQPLEDVVALSHQYGARCIADGAQVAGHMPVTLDALGVDAWVCSGHKGFLGPKGVGLMYLASNFELPITVWGGTGIGDADDLCDTHVRPMCYEPGTEPLPAILGLEAGVTWLSHNSHAVERASKLGTLLRKSLSGIEGFRVLGPALDQPHLALVSITIEKITPEVFGSILAQQYDIITRTGMHCAPDACRVLDTYPQGTVRFSLGPFNTKKDVEAIVAAVREIVIG
jgi:selenocysteine lyase/cysteine desulfurase